MRQAHRIYRNTKKIRRRRTMRRMDRLTVILIGLFVIGYLAICIWFYSYLSDYESVQPVHIMETLVALYNAPERLSEFLTEHQADLKTIEKPEYITSQYISFVYGKTITFQENVELTRFEKPVYDILADGSVVGRFYLEETSEKSHHGFLKYGISDMELIDYLPDSISISILVPQGASVTVNGHLLGDQYLLSSGTPDLLKNSLPYIENPPVYDTYFIDVLSDDIEIKGTDKNGKELLFGGTTDTYVGGGLADDAFLDSVRRVVERGVEVWGEYFIYEDHTLPLYVMEGSDLYAYLFGSDEVNSIDPSLYNYELISDYYYEELIADNYILYARDCFSVDVRYTLRVQFMDSAMQDDVQQLNATWIWVPDGDSWSISDVIYH